MSGGETVMGSREHSRLSVTICPVCGGGELVTASWFDEEGIEAWECPTCGFGVMGDWAVPPASDDLTEDWRGTPVEQLRAVWVENAAPVVGDGMEQTVDDAAGDVMSAEDVESWGTAD